ncbi:MAG TPA: 2-amino-4-hydroxy-6-hydroxymethyldihydropteridine diphosphokinase [Xanthomonadales bacterium]|nr:2-amino-4-hydroxy-6-hydroxymethyldihydropteridine diphosphokinase [Xanthomonadales bacterium]
MERAWLSLGSNLEPEKHRRAALAELRARYGAVVVSPTYRTRAVGFDGPDFLNLAVGIDTDETPQALDEWLHALEARHGRVRTGSRYSSRTLDADIVLFGERIVHGPGNLEIPRGELVKHAFVLQPMADVAPDVVHPQLRVTIGRLWAAFEGDRASICDAVDIS